MAHNRSNTGRSELELIEHAPLEQGGLVIHLPGEVRLLVGILRPEMFGDVLVLAVPATL